jgi:hypothetical protein
MTHPIAALNKQMRASMRDSEAMLLDEQQRFLDSQQPAAASVKRVTAAKQPQTQPATLSTGQVDCTAAPPQQTVGDLDRGGDESIQQGVLSSIVGTIVEHQTRGRVFEPPSFTTRPSSLFASRASKTLGNGNGNGSGSGSDSPSTSTGRAIAPPAPQPEFSFPPPLHRSVHSFGKAAATAVKSQPPTTTPLPTASDNKQPSTNPVSVTTTTTRTTNTTAPIGSTGNINPLYNTRVEVEKLSWIFPELTPPSASSTTTPPAITEWRFDFEGVWVSPERSASEPTHSGTSFVLSTMLGIVHAFNPVDCTWCRLASSWPITRQGRLYHS